MAPQVSGLWRYPVKSMLGEEVDRIEVGARGVVGDRAFAVVDLDDGTVASAKNPAKWGGLLTLQAVFVAEGVVEITGPDGLSVRSDAPDVDAVLSSAIGRQVTLASSAPEGAAFEEVWPDIAGLAPEPIIAGTNVGTDPDGERISRFPLAGMAPAGTFFDLALLHVMTSATLARLQELAPDATFDVRRYRPNVLVDTGAVSGFVENGWVGRVVGLGGARVEVTMATMRCVMTTLAQQGLPRDRDTLRTIAAHNQVEIPGMGSWACAGVYGNVDAPGTVAVGDPVLLT